jgi:hypothetical protein
LVIAEFDATVNEAEGVVIPSFPQLKFYSRDNKAAVDYNGAREYLDIVNWLADNSSAYKEHFA